MGGKKWRGHVEKVVALLKHGLQVDYVMLGGGQTKKLKRLPPGVRLGKNANAILGGFRLWDATRPPRRRAQVAGSRRKARHGAGDVASSRPSGTES
jgi:hypothetical protein